MRPSTALTLNDTLKEIAMPSCVLGVLLGDGVGHEVGARLRVVDGVEVGDDGEGIIGDAVGATPGTAVGAMASETTALGAGDDFGVGTIM